MDLHLQGLHHLTAVTAEVGANHAFYTGSLGLRLVKKTVNQDDVRAYHLFYADGVASPGSDLTFFDWPQMASERRGSHTISRIGLRVAGAETLAWWAARFDALGVRQSEITVRDARRVLDFEDFEGQRLSLVDDGGEGPAFPWDGSPVPATHQIRGLGPVTITLRQLAPTDRVLTQILNMRLARDYADPASPQHRVYVFEMGPGGAGAELHVAVRPEMPLAQPGAGGVHHVAFRVPDDETHRQWLQRLTTLGIQTSGVIDRFYFRSIYMREPNGILFELATDGPGFAVDEAPDRLGQELSLPPFLAARRREIEANLRPLAEGTI